MLPVAFVAALVSYRHLSGLLAFYGEEPIVCVLGPLAVDGLMVMATGAILATGHHQHTTRIRVRTRPPRTSSGSRPRPRPPSRRRASPRRDRQTNPTPRRTRNRQRRRNP